MLDAKSMAVLQSVNNLCKNGTYEILSIEDIIAELPKKSRMDDKAVREIIEQLTSQKLVSVKYSDEHEFCLAPLPDGKMKCDSGSGSNGVSVVGGGSKKYFLTAFFGAFFGSVIGGAIVAIIVHFAGL